jgi:GNAT superfamily N-acetyltransferase
MTNRYTIVAARPQDVGLLPAIELAAARLLAGHAPDAVLDETTGHEVLDKAQGDGRLWVALEHDRPVGFAHVEMIEAGSAHLQELDVHPQYGRQGLGTGLVTHVCRWAAMAGCRSVTLSTFRDVAWNMPFYARLGFAVVSAEQLSVALRALVEDERRRGLDLSRRVVMRRMLPSDNLKMSEPTIVASDAAAVEDLQYLEEQVNEYNFATTGIRDARLLVMLLRDSAGRIYAGLSGHTWGGVAEIKFLWVDESNRHTGVGSRLLRAAEAEARSRGCLKVVLSTHSFQAPGFYRKHGYVVAGEFSDYPRGYTSIFLEKLLGG